MASQDVKNWTCEDVKLWLCEQGLEEYVYLFCEQHKLDGKSLLLLSENDLKQPPMEIKVLGDVKRIVIALNDVKRKNQLTIQELRGINTSLNDNASLHGNSYHCNGSREMNGGEDIKLLRRYQCFDSDSSVMSDLGEDDYHGHGVMSTHLQPEYVKLVLSYIYMFSVFLLTSFVMVIVHDRVPDMEKYPPLPDLVLDNLPVIPWAFEMCELTATLLFIIFAVTMVFHKHRFIIMRRLFALTGTVFLLRCVTMLITSLSVPGTHLKCEPMACTDTWMRIERTLTIWKGMGMSLQGVRTCGDYMFSGHTAIVTMLNFFITEYTPRKLYFLHTATWVMNIFGIFFILAAHEHYSIDVFVSFYLTSRLFLYYHSLANNRALRQPDRRRMWIWFPLFSFFEAKVDGILPNEYEWPFPSFSDIMAFFQRHLKKE